jgi:hypothetical protein
MGNYGTNVEGFGGFEGGVNADKGAPLVSTSSDGETALLFGPAALREIQAGVANGDFAIPPDEAGSTITSENPLPYWTFTDVNSAGAITCAVVADANAGSGNVLRWSVAASTPSGVSATLTRFVPVASTQNQAFVYVAEMTNKASATTNSISKRITQQYYTQDFTATGFAPGATSGFNTNLQTSSKVGPDFSVVAPAEAAFLLITITIFTNSTTPASVTTNDLFEVRLIRGEQTLFISEGTDPATYFATRISQGNGLLSIRPGVSAEIIGNLEVSDGGTPGQGSLEVEGNLQVDLDASITGTLDVSGDAEVTGNLQVDGDLNTDGMFTAANIASGAATVDPVTANAVSSVNVTGLSVKTSAGTPTNNDVSVLVTAISAAAALRSCTASAPTFSGSNLTGFTINIFRTNTTATGVWFLAIGR